METKGITYEEVADLARIEVDEMDLPQSTEETLQTVIQSFVDLYQGNGNWRSHDGFALHLTDVSTELFNKFSSVASRLKASPGHIMNFLMDRVIKTGSLEFTAKDLKSFVDNLDRNITLIQHHKSISITMEDLHDVEFLLLQHIKDVEIADDIDEDLFRSKVKILYCKNVRIPKTLSKLIVLSKIQFTKKFIFQEQEPSIVV